MIRVVGRRAALVLAYMGLVLGLSSLPGARLSRLGLSAALVNLTHVPLFAGLAWVTLWAFVGPTMTRVVAPAVLCMVFAVTDEWYQSFIPGRVPALDDLVTDAAGIAVAIAWQEALRPLLGAWRREARR